MDPSDHNSRRMARLAGEERATRKAIIKGFNDEQKREGAPETPVFHFILASGGLTCCAVFFVMHSNANLPYYVNAFLFGSLIGVAAVGITNGIVQRAFQSMIFRVSKGTFVPIVVVIGGYMTLFALWCAAIIGVAMWVARETTDRKGSYAWEWIAGWLR